MTSTDVSDSIRFSLTISTSFLASDLAIVVVDVVVADVTFAANVAREGLETVFGASSAVLAGSGSKDAPDTLLSTKESRISKDCQAWNMLVTSLTWSTVLGQSFVQANEFMTYERNSS